MAAPPDAEYGIDPRLMGLPFELVDRLLLQAARLAGARSHMVQTPQGPGHVLELVGKGKGPPIVLLHGLGSCGADYVPLMRILKSSHRRLLAPDLPGHGRAPIPRGGMQPGPLIEALVGTLDAVLTEPAIVFGNSLGGLAAIRYAQARPQRVRALILASPGGAPQDDHNLRAFIDSFQMRDHAAALQFVDRFLGRPNTFRGPMARGVRNRMGRTGTQQLVRNVNVDMLLTPADLQTLKMPTLVFWGDQDAVMASSDLSFFENNLPPRGRFMSASGYGHAPYLDSAGDFVKLLRPFLLSVQ